MKLVFISLWIVFCLPQYSFSSVDKKSEADCHQLEASAKSAFVVLTIKEEEMQKAEEEYSKREKKYQKSCSDKNQ